MELEPAHIRNHRFKKQVFGGYKPEDVQKFLLNVSEAYAQVKLEQQMLSERLKETQESLNRVRGIEEALLQGLKQAESQKEEIISQSKKEAEVRVMEGKVAADALVSTAKQKAQQMLHSVKQECELKLEKMKADFDILDQSYTEVENHVEKLIAQMQRFVEDTNQQIAHLSSLKHQKAVEQKLSASKKLIQQKSSEGNEKPKDSPKPTISTKEIVKGSNPKTTQSYPPQPKPRNLHESLLRKQQPPEDDMREFFKGIDQ